MTESQTIMVPMELDAKEMDVLKQIHDKVNKEGNNWSFEQILTELAVINLHNWNKMQFLATLSPPRSEN